MNEIDALVDAIESAGGFPPCTPREFAVRVEQQLAQRGVRLLPVNDEPVDNPVDNPGAIHG